MGGGVGSSQAHHAALRGMRERRPQQSRGLVEPSRTAAEQPCSPHSRHHPPPAPQPLGIDRAAGCTGKWHQNQYGDWGSCLPRGCAEAVQPVRQPLAWVTFPQGHTDPLSGQAALSFWLAVLPKYGHLLPQREGEGGH